MSPPQSERRGQSLNRARCFLPVPPVRCCSGLWGTIRLLLDRRLMVHSVQTGAIPEAQSRATEDQIGAVVREEGQRRAVLVEFKLAWVSKLP